MRFSKQVNGLALAVAAAAVFATVPMSASANEGAAGKGHCVGANACKGKGFTETSAEECAKSGGKFEEPKPTTK